MPRRVVLLSLEWIVSIVYSCFWLAQKHGESVKARWWNDDVLL